MSKKCKKSCMCFLFMYLFVCAISFVSFGGAAVVNSTTNYQSSIMNSKSYETKNTVLTIDYPTYNVVGKIIWAKDWKTKNWTMNFNGNNNKFIMASNGWYKVTENVDGITISDIYFVDENGFLITGFITTKDGSTYFMEEKENQNMGKLVYGWYQTNDQKWYYFDNNGKMVRNGYSPDGMYLSNDGAWIKGGATFGPGGELIGNSVRLVSNNQGKQRIWEDGNERNVEQKNVSHKVEFSKGPGEGMITISDQTGVISDIVKNDIKTTRRTNVVNNSNEDNDDMGVMTYNGEAPTQEVKGPGAFIEEEEEEYIYYYE